MRKKFLLIMAAFILSLVFADNIKADYQIKEGGVFYGDTEKIDEADAASFKMLDREYATDKNYVYFRANVITGADPATFTRMQLPYSKDKNAVYYYETAVSYADPGSFIKLNNIYAKDKINAYYKSNAIINSDPVTFTVLLDNQYAKDKNNYYHDGEIISSETELRTAKSKDPEITSNVFVEKLKGKILLQVEQNGEAWYVHPGQRMRYYLGTPQDAFNIMKNFGIGMSNNDFKKIPLADMNLSNAADSDQDGLSDQVEAAFGTDKYNRDTDNDGFNDKEEILSGYDPNGKTKLGIDLKFVAGRKGFIYIQADQNGESWYINPDDSKRYFLGRPQDAFNVMRRLGLGITDENLNKIVENK